MFASNIVTCPKRAHAVLAIIGDEREKKENQEDTAGATCRSVDAVAPCRAIQIHQCPNRSEAVQTIESTCAENGRRRAGTPEAILRPTRSICRRTR